MEFCYQNCIFFCLKVVLETIRLIVQQYIFTSLYFPCPILFSTFNVVVHVATSKLLLVCRKSSKIDGGEDKVVKLIDDWVVLRYILPIGLYVATSLVASQFIYLYLDMHFIQLLQLCFPVVFFAMERILRPSPILYSQICCIFTIIFGIRIVLFDFDAFPLVAFLIMLTSLWYESVSFFTTQELSHYLLTITHYTPLECYFLYYLITYFWLILATCCFEVPLFLPHGIGMMIVEHMPFFALTMCLSVLLTLVDSVLLNQFTPCLQSDKLIQEMSGWFWSYKAYQGGSIIVLYALGVFLFGEEVTRIQHSGAGIVLIGGLTFYCVRLMYRHDRNQAITPNETQHDPELTELDGHIMC